MLQTVESPTLLSRVTVGITNTGMNAAKRGIAVELALRLAAHDAPTCLVAADPTDRDVQRRMPALIAKAGEYTRRQVENGPH
ncbi:MAG TPA: hypothetical protein VFR41_00315, partial [Acidimicrobiia bacterium]|nr:hypothetical protein [Acidimicrobiia bacterium]